LAYARRGKPVIPTRHYDDPDPLLRKAPRTWNGFHGASTDASKVHGYWTANPGASIGVVAGEESGWWVLDVDRLQALDELGLELPPTLTVRTPSGGLHYYFKHDPRIAGNGRGRLPEGVDVRGGGRGYSLLPPSKGYTWEAREEITQAPERLIAMIAEPKRPTPRPRRSDGAQTTLDLDGPAILEGTRHSTMLSLAGRLHDGSRTAEDLRRDLLSINEARCTPPLPMDEVEAIARWTSEKDPCSSGRPAELEAMLERLGDAWYGMERRGTGEKNEVRFARVILDAGTRFGTVVEDGLRVSLSIRQAAEALSCGDNTVMALRRRMEEKGLLRYDRSEVGRKTATGSGSGAFVLLARRTLHTPPDSSYMEGIGGGVSTSSRPPAGDLETAHYRHMGPVGYSREDTLCHVEAHPGRTVEELADILGWSRTRDLKRHLLPLVDLGLVEIRDGRLWTPEAYEERQDAVKRTAYSTLQLRGVRRFDHDAGRWVHFVAESGSIASQEKREEHDRERHRTEREFFRQRVEEKRAEAERSCTGDDPVYIEHDGSLVDVETGEVVGVADQTGWDPDETTDRTEAC
jgi:hypothetical protein